MKSTERPRRRGDVTCRRCLARVARANQRTEPDAGLDKLRNDCADENLADSDNPPPEVIAQEIVDDLEAALEQLRPIAGDSSGASVDLASRL
jgi:hypothetical protein